MGTRKHCDISREEQIAFSPLFLSCLFIVVSGITEDDKIL